MYISSFMKRLICVTIFALSIPLVFNCILFSENTEFRHIYQRCVSKISPTDWYNQHLIYANNGDKKSAEVCLSISAQLGCAEAQFRLARLLMDEGKEKLAEIWMIEAAKQGNAEHQYQLGRWYDYVFSHESREKCKSSAFIWYEKSAVQNHALAAKFLAQCYRLGNGCERDLSAAEYWYKKALELGEWVNRGLAEVYIETGRPELAVPLLSAEAAEGSIQARNILKGLQKKQSKTFQENGSKM